MRRLLKTVIEVDVWYEDYTGPDGPEAECIIEVSDEGGNDLWPYLSDDACLVLEEECADDYCEIVEAQSERAEAEKEEAARERLKKLEMQRKSNLG